MVPSDDVGLAVAVADGVGVDDWVGVGDWVAVGVGDCVDVGVPSSKSRTPPSSAVGVGVGVGAAVGDGDAVGVAPRVGVPLASVRVPVAVVVVPGVPPDVGVAVSLPAGVAVTTTGVDVTDGPSVPLTPDRSPWVGAPNATASPAENSTIPTRRKLYSMGFGSWSWDGLGELSREARSAPLVATCFHRDIIGFGYCTYSVFGVSYLWAKSGIEGVRRPVPVAGVRR